MKSIVYDTTTYERAITYDMKYAARDILSMIEMVSFSEDYRDYRVRYGSRGERDLIVQMIKDKYKVE